MKDGKDMSVEMFDFDAVILGHVPKFKARIQLGEAIPESLSATLGLELEKSYERFAIEIDRLKHQINGVPDIPPYKTPDVSGVPLSTLLEMVETLQGTRARLAKQLKSEGVSSPYPWPRLDGKYRGGLKRGELFCLTAANMGSSSGKSMLTTELKIEESKSD